MPCMPAIPENILVTSARTKAERWWTSVPTRATAELLAPRWHPRKPQGPVILPPVLQGVESVPRPVLCDLECDVVQVARGVGVVGDEGSNVLCHSP